MARRRDKNNFAAIANQIPAEMEASIAEGAALVAQYAKSRVSVRTGALRDAIHVKRDGWTEYLVVAGNNDVFYGHMVEFGTNHSGAQPFLIPALESARKEVKRIGDHRLKNLEPDK
jgi:HK97 gp10 family phage protein